MSKNVILRSMRFTTNVHINCYFLLLSIIVLIHLLVANYIIPFYGIVSEIAKNQKSSNIKHQNNVNKYTSRVNQGFLGFVGFPLQKECGELPIPCSFFRESTGSTLILFRPLITANLEKPRCPPFKWGWFADVEINFDWSDHNEGNHGTTIRNQGKATALSSPSQGCSGGAGANEALHCSATCQTFPIAG